MLYLPIITLRAHGHCCSKLCGMKLMNMLSGSESTVKAKRLILNCQTLIMTEDSTLQGLTAYKKIKNEHLKY